eukprot:TRINITY_DN23231_c0_g2_i2.p2 TRINITY_DN23231_c0_g2~~TRINITY_DN23231_c0_g2_i2.p2  ORF type:complete len:133 (-),score=16.46 TRINITY_DN23231_c0_g2_i2:195-593(-)
MAKRDQPNNTAETRGSSQQNKRIRNALADAPMAAPVAALAATRLGLSSEALPFTASKSQPSKPGSCATLLSIALCPVSALTPPTMPPSHSPSLSAASNAARSCTAALSSSLRQPTPCTQYDAKLLQCRTISS